VQITTAPEATFWIERFLGLDAASRLSRAALETLAIIAYQEPVTRPQVDAVRGVNSDGVLKSLLSKGLIQEVGRAEAPGRPILYSITDTFLQHFGLSGKNELPPLIEDAGDTRSVDVGENRNGPIPEDSTDGSSGAG
jgi:segregation and condensation protein B